MKRPLQPNDEMRTLDDLERRVRSLELRPQAPYNAGAGGGGAAAPLVWNDITTFYNGASRFSTFDHPQWALANGWFYMRGVVRIPDPIGPTPWDHAFSGGASYQFGQWFEFPTPDEMSASYSGDHAFSDAIVVMQFSAGGHHVTSDEGTVFDGNPLGADHVARLQFDGFIGGSGGDPCNPLLCWRTNFAPNLGNIHLKLDAVRLPVDTTGSSNGYAGPLMVPTG